MKIRYALFLLYFAFSACNNNRSGQETLADCPYPVPVAVFSDTLAAVDQHQFALNAMEGVEEVSFRNGMALTLIQSGCEARKQEFQFRLPGNFDPQAPSLFWVNQTIEQLNYLVGLGPQYVALSAWSQMIEQLKEQIQLGEPLEVQPGFFIEIDRIKSADYAILLLTLSERS